MFVCLCVFLCLSVSVCIQSREIGKVFPPHSRSSARARASLFAEIRNCSSDRLLTGAYAMATGTPLSVAGRCIVDHRPKCWLANKNQHTHTHSPTKCLSDTTNFPNRHDAFRHLGSGAASSAKQHNDTVHMRLPVVNNTISLARPPCRLALAGAGMR